MIYEEPDFTVGWFLSLRFGKPERALLLVGSE